MTYHYTFIRVFDLYGEDMELGTMFGEYMKQHT